MRGDSSYLSASHPALYVPADLLTPAHEISIRVFWPSGHTQRFPYDGAGGPIQLVQSAANTN